MWSVRSEPIQRGRGERYEVRYQGESLSLAMTIDQWQTNASFRAWFNQLLAASPYSAFRWETPAATRDSLAKPFEFVLLDSPGLARAPERGAFAEHFPQAAGGVTSFHNLGRDAQLVVPLPLADDSQYGHLAAFVRGAPDQQRDELWQLVGRCLQARVSEQPVWLSTAGAGVSWLHVRLDDRPKYYGFGPYRDAKSN